MSAMHEKKTDRQPEVSPDGSLYFLFGIFSLLIWYACVFPLSADGLLAIGSIQIFLSFGALAASFINLLRGKMRANLNLIATILLGFFPGICTLIQLFARLSGKPFSPRIYGLMYMVGSIFCFGVMFRRLGKPIYRWIATLLIAAGLFSIGLGDVCGIRIILNLGGWLLFGYALCSFYMGLSEMYYLFGYHLPQGPVLKKFHTGREERL